MLQGTPFNELGDKVWRGVKTFVCEALEGNQEWARKGGLYTFVSPKIQHLIADSGVIGVN
jgi:hypothetical protein